MSLRNIFLFLLGVLLLSILLAVTGVAKHYEYVDVPLHILGGFGWAMIAANLIVRAKAPSQPKWFNFLFTVGVVLLVGVLWEFFEFGISHWAGPQTWRDTLGDLMNDG